VRPADLEDSGLLQVDEDDDDDMPMTVAEPAVRIADIKPIAARPSALGQVPGIDEHSWYEESQSVDRLDEASFGTRFVRRPSRTKSVLLLCAAFATGLVATAYIAWPGRQAAIAPVTPEPAAAVAPAAAPKTTVVEPAAVAAPPAVVPPTTTEAQPAVVEPAVVEPVAPAVPAKLAVELDSEPEGATVLLVDGSTTITLGSTPLSHELEPSKSYELMFTLAGHKSALVTVDPTRSQRVNVDLTTSTATASARAETAVAVVADEPAAPAEPAVAKAEPRAAPKAAPRAPKAEPKAAPKARVTKTEPPKSAAPAIGGKGGMLMIGSKPPCEIFIDGKPTRLKTPQREIKLAPGSHKITLVNKEHKITETFSVDVKAGASTKVVKDLTKRMK
jgi:hypothetical protein